MLLRNGLLPRLIIWLLAAGISGSAWATIANPLAIPPDADLAAAATSRLETRLPPAMPSDPAALQDRLKELARRYHAVDFDSEERAKQLGAGADSAFLYVRDHIRFESYPGAFRGARGTYRSRAGNAADRSLLLAQLLASKGIPVRFALGHLSDENATKLFDRIFEPNAAGDDASITLGGADFVERLRTRSLRDYAAISAATAGKLLPQDPAEKEQLIQEIANHVWVQAKVNDQWIDLDPSFADATPGKRLCEATRAVDALPDELYQHVIIRVVNEKLAGNELKREVALELTRRVVDVAEKQIFLVHVPQSGLKGMGAAVGGGKDSFAPSLWIDGDVVPGKLIAFGDDTGASGGGAAGAIGEVIGALDAAPPAAPTGSRFVSETLEFQVNIPGRPADVTRSVLADCGSAAWRLTTPLDPHHLRAVPRNENGPIPAQTLHNIWFSAGAHDLASYAQSIQLLSQMAHTAATAPAAPKDVEPEFGTAVWPLAIKNLSWMLWGEHVFLPALNSDSADTRFYLDSPRIVLFSFSAAVDKAQPDHFTLNSQVDLRRDIIRSVSRNPNGLPPSHGRMWYAVLEGALEHELASQEAGAFTGDVKVESTSGLLDERGAVAIAGPAPDSGWEKLAADRETAARLREALAPDTVLVVPKRVLDSGPSGWWAVNVRTGETHPVLGTGANGSGLGVNGSYARGAPYGGSSGPSVNYVDPKTGNSYSPRRAGRGGGSEYTTILVTISLPGGLAMAGLIAGVASVIWIIVKILF